MGIRYNWQSSMQTGFLLGNTPHPSYQPAYLLNQPHCMTTLAVHVYENNLPDSASGQTLPDYSYTLQATAVLHGGHVLQAQPNELQAIFYSERHNGQHATKAITAALAMMEQINVINQHRHPDDAADAAPLRISIGVDTGPVTIHTEMLNTHITANGKSLQIASQLRELNKQAPFPTIFISAQTYQYLPDSTAWHIENLGNTLWTAGQMLTVYAVVPY